MIILVYLYLSIIDCTSCSSNTSLGCSCRDKYRLHLHSCMSSWFFYIISFYARLRKDKKVRMHNNQAVLTLREMRHWEKWSGSYISVSFGKSPLIFIYRSCHQQQIQGLQYNYIMFSFDTKRFQVAMLMIFVLFIRAFNTATLNFMNSTYHVSR